MQISLKTTSGPDGRARRPRRRVAGGIAVLVMAGVALIPGKALAGYTTCTTDPTIVLSDGESVTLSSTVGTSADMVSQVQYVLHVPHHLHANSVTYDQFSDRESVQVVDDQHRNQFAVDATVTTTDGNVPVTVSASLDDRRRISETSGLSNQTLHIDFKRDNHD